MLDFLRTKPFKCFTGEYGHLKVDSSSYRGVEPIKIEDIVGSVGRCHDFGRGLKFKWADTEHFNSIKRNMEAGEVLPPIKVYRVGSEHYILDGHHRVVAGQQVGRKFFDAEVIELSFAGKKQDPDYSDCPRREFTEKTGLAGVLYRSREKYKQVLQKLEDLHRSLKGEKSLKEVAADWYHGEFLSQTQKQQGDCREDSSDC